MGNGVQCANTTDLDQKYVYAQRSRNSKAHKWRHDSDKTQTKKPEWRTIFLKQFLKQPVFLEHIFETKNLPRFHLVLSDRADVIWASSGYHHLHSIFRVLTLRYWQPRFRFPISFPFSLKKYTFFRSDDVSCRLICVGERTVYSLIKGYRSKHLVLSSVGYLCKVICFSKLLNTPWFLVLEIKHVSLCSFQFWTWILINPFQNIFCFQCKRTTANWAERCQNTAIKS